MDFYVYIYIFFFFFILLILLLILTTEVKLCVPNFKKKNVCMSLKNVCMSWLQNNFSGAHNNFPIIIKAFGFSTPNVNCSKTTKTKQNNRDVCGLYRVISHISL